MSAIHRCPDHGVFDTERAEACPVCGARGDPVLDGRKRVQLSKFLSGALRHFPEDAGLTLTERGWAEYSQVVDVVTNRYSWVDEEAIDAVITTDPKGRFEREDAGRRRNGTNEERTADRGRIRAAYGHSVDVTLEPGDGSIPDRLYHGTAPSNREAIASEGLRPMNRREVHLSRTPEEARTVGARHATAPIVFAVDARGLLENGHRVTERGRGVYTTDRVPPRFLTVSDLPDRVGDTSP